MDAYNVGLKDKFNTLKNNAKEKATGLKDNMKDKLSKKNSKTPDSSSTTEKKIEPPSSITPSSNYDSLNDIGKAVVEMLSGGGLGNGKWSLTKHYEICNKYGVSPVALRDIEQQCGITSLYNDSEEAEQKRAEDYINKKNEDFLNRKGVEPDRVAEPTPYATFDVWDKVNEDERNRLIQEGVIEGGDDFRQDYYDRIYDDYHKKYDPGMNPHEFDIIEQGTDKSYDKGLNEGDVIPDLRYKKKWSPLPEMASAIRQL